MGQMNSITQQNASFSEQLAATAEELTGQAGQLQQLTKFFKISNGHRGTIDLTPTRSAKPMLVNSTPARTTALGSNLSDIDEAKFNRF
jgi:methyl-accepting chemotaxis protein